jgi:DNA-binding phage protein
MIDGEVGPLDAARFLTSAESEEGRPNDALACSNAGFVSQALGLIARAQGMDAAREAGVTREALCKHFEWG